MRERTKHYEKRKLTKKIISVCVAVFVMFSALLSDAYTLQAEAKAPTKGSGFDGLVYQEWCQKMSKYAGLQKGGCRVTTYTKMLYEAGYTQVTNPDKFFEWGVGNGYFKKSSAYEKVSFGTPAIQYVKAQGGSASLVKKISIKGMKKAKVAETIMSYINDGYYCILSCSAHTSYVGREASLAAKTPVLLDSSYSTSNKAWSGTYSNIINYTNYKSNNFTNLRVFKISKGSGNGGSGNSGSGTQSSVKVTKPTISLTDYPVRLLKGNSFGLRGTITANGNITLVKGYIYNADGKVVQSTTDKPYVNSFNIKNGNVNQKLVFGKLASGNYTLKIEATNSAGKTTITKNFSVISKPKVSITTAPSTIKKGKSFGLRGTIKADSNAKITAVKSYIVDSKGKTVQSASDKANTTSFNVKNGNINQKLYFGKLAKGTYTLKIEATNMAGTTTYTKKFTVK